MAAGTAVLGIVRDVRLAAVPASIAVAVEIAPEIVSGTIELAFRIRTDGTDVRRKYARFARPDAGASVDIGDPALRPAGAAIVRIAIERRAGLSALRVARRTAARAPPANFAVLAGIPARAAVQRVRREVGFAAILQLAIAIASLWST